ncbi:hypothetical protein LIER_40423 [Lithospermum erythrorhizon]|uniref:Uncharacterized protein n=1 Tax=Lithospermum erythrorhizon TaxID=34254 RepID=A0AAV3QVS8_LITER
MMFYLTTLNLSRFFTKEAPVLGKDEVNPHTLAVVEGWKHSDYLCRNYVLNGLSDDLFPVYRTLETTKKVWEALKYKYRTQDAGVKKFIVGMFLHFKMVDDKSIDNQVQELEVMFRGIHAEGIVVSKSFQAAAIIEKLPQAGKTSKITPNINERK